MQQMLAWGHNLTLPDKARERQRQRTRKQGQSAEASSTQGVFARLRGSAGRCCGRLRIAISLLKNPFDRTPKILQKLVNLFLTN